MHWNLHEQNLKQGNDYLIHVSSIRQMKYKLIKRMKKTTLILLVLLSCQLILAQRKAGSVTQECNPVTFTTQQDHQNMMDQLGIISVQIGRASCRERV